MTLVQRKAKFREQHQNLRVNGWDERDYLLWSQWFFYDGNKHNNRRIVIPTLEGNMVGEIGDWIIKGVKGEFYPCKPDIFDTSYEPVK